MCDESSKYQFADLTITSSKAELLIDIELNSSKPRNDLLAIVTNRADAVLIIPHALAKRNPAPEYEYSGTGSEIIAAEC
jgi:hypothetical protein